jgi:hypothetical protein
MTSNPTAALPTEAGAKTFIPGCIFWFVFSKQAPKVRLMVESFRLFGEAYPMIGKAGILNLI